MKQVKQAIRVTLPHNKPRVATPSANVKIFSKTKKTVATFGRCFIEIPLKIVENERHNDIQYTGLAYSIFY